MQPNRILTQREREGVSEGDGCFDLTANLFGTRSVDVRPRSVSASKGNYVAQSEASDTQSRLLLLLLLLLTIPAAAAAAAARIMADVPHATHCNERDFGSDRVISKRQKSTNLARRQPEIIFTLHIIGELTASRPLAIKNANLFDSSGQA